MKKNLLLLVAAIFTLFGYSQGPLSLSLSDSSGPVVNNGTRVKAGLPTDDEMVYYLFVTNNSVNPMYVKVKKVKLSVLPGTMNTFCWGLCYAPSVYLSPDSIMIQPGETDSVDFSGHYNPTNVKGVTSMRYVFFNPADPADSVCANIEFSAYPVGIENPVTTALSNAYPNPANNMISFDYNVVAGSILLIRNMLGSVVREVKIDNTAGKLTIPVTGLNEGCYFYSLITNNNPVVTKRFVVLH